MASHESHEEKNVSPTDTEICQEMEPVVGVGSEEPVGDMLAELQVAPAPQNAPANLVLFQPSTSITNVVNNRQISCQQTVNQPHPMQVGTLIGGKHNLKLTAESHSTVNIYNGRTEEKPCHMPSRDNIGEEIAGCPTGTDAIPHVDYNDLMFTVMERFEKDDRLYRRVKYNCRSNWGTRHGIPQTILRDLEPEKFIECLEQCQLLGPYNMDFLYQLMQKLKQIDLTEGIAEYTKFHASDRIENHKPNGTIAEDKFHTEVVLNGDISQRSNRDVNRYKEIFEVRFGIPKSAASFIGTGEGSVVLVFQLPLRWPGEQPGGIGDIDVLARLADDVSQRADWLMDSDVIGIHIEGRQYVDLTGVSPKELKDIEEESLLSDIDDEGLQYERVLDDFTKLSTADSTDLDELKDIEEESLLSDIDDEGLQYKRVLDDSTKLSTADSTDLDVRRTPIKVGDMSYYHNYPSRHVPRQQKFDTNPRLPQQHILISTTTSAIHQVEYSNLKIHEEIGKGGNGMVRRVTFKEDYRGYTEAAIKRLINLNSDEAEMLSNLSHPNIVKVLGICQFVPVNLLVLELSPDGSLYDYLRKERLTPIQENLLRKWLKECALAMKYLHESNIIHMNIKSSNCLLFHHNVLKLCNFGLVANHDDLYQLNEATSHTTLEETWRYKAPELLKPKRKKAHAYSKYTDIFSYGMLIFEICSRDAGMTIFHRVNKLVGSDEVILPTIPATCPEDLSDLMLFCWKANPKERPTVERIIYDLLYEELLLTSTPGYQRMSLRQYSYCPEESQTLDHRGGKIVVPDTDACLVVPPEALSDGDEVDVVVSVHWGNDYPPLQSNTSIIGPVVSCKPDGLKFQKRVKITLPHSAKNITARHITIWTKKSSRPVHPWEILMETNYDLDIDKENKISIWTDHFTLFTPIINFNDPTESIPEHYSSLLAIPPPVPDPTVPQLTVPLPTVPKYTVSEQTLEPAVTEPTDPIKGHYQSIQIPEPDPAVPKSSVLLPVVPKHTVSTQTLEPDVPELTDPMEEHYQSIQIPEPDPAVPKVTAPLPTVPQYTVSRHAHEPTIPKPHIDRFMLPFLFPPDLKRGKAIITIYAVRADEIKSIKAVEKEEGSVKCGPQRHLLVKWQDTGTLKFKVNYIDPEGCWDPEEHAEKKVQMGGRQSFCSVVFEKTNKSVDSIMGFINALHNDEHIIEDSRFYNPPVTAEREPQDVRTRRVSGKDILDITDIFSARNLDDVYTHLEKIERNDVDDATQACPRNPKQQAKRILDLWCDRNSESATRDAMIGAMEQCRDFRASVDVLKRRWRDNSHD